MKIELIVISVVLVMLVFLPFYLLPLIQLRGNKKFSRLFNQETDKHKLHIDIKESWNVNIAGIDITAQKLIVVQALEEPRIHYFDLKEVKNTELLLSTIPLIKNGKTENILQEVNLVFSFYTKEAKEALCLYNYDLNIYQDLEVKHAEKLQQHIQRVVMAHPVMKKTA